MLLVNSQGRPRLGDHADRPLARPRRLARSTSHGSSNEMEPPETRCGLYGRWRAPCGLRTRLSNGNANFELDIPAYDRIGDWITSLSALRIYKILNSKAPEDRSPLQHGAPILIESASLAPANLGRHGKATAPQPSEHRHPSNRCGPHRFQSHRQCSHSICLHHD